MQSEPLISEFIIEIRRFDDIDHEIDLLPDSQVVGSLELDYSQSALHLLSTHHVRQHQLANDNNILNNNNNKTTIYTGA